MANRKEQLSGDPTDGDRNNLVTVVVPCYNDGVYLLENLESLQAQTYRNFEVVVVNDGSTDPKTLEVLGNLEQAFPSLDLRVYSQSNQGLPGARNRGIHEAQGHWIMMFDADDKLAPEHLSKTVTLASSNDLDFVTTDIQNFGEQNFISRVKINFYDELFANRILGCSFFKREVLVKEPYDAEFRSGFEDWELWIRLLKQGFRGEVIHEPLYLYRRRSGSMLADTHFNRPKIIKKIREKHTDLYKPEQLAQIKQEHGNGWCVTARLYDFHYRLGLHSPYLAYWMGRIYLRLRPLQSILK